MALFVVVTFTAVILAAVVVVVGIYVQRRAFSARLNIYVTKKK